MKKGRKKKHGETNNNCKTKFRTGDENAAKKGTKLIPNYEQLNCHIRPRFIYIGTIATAARQQAEWIKSHLDDFIYSLVICVCALSFETDALLSTVGRAQPVVCTYGGN